MTDKKNEFIRIEGVLEFGYGIIPMMVIADNRLSSSAVRLYGALMNFAREKNTAFPKQKVLASILGVRVQTISELTSELEMHGYIRKLREGKNGSITYIMNMIINREVDVDLFGEYIVDKAKAPKKKAVNKAQEEKVSKKDLDSISEYYIEKFIEKSGGVEPDYKYARDNAVFSSYLKKYDVNILERIIDLYFEDDWGKKCGYSVVSIQTAFNKLLLEAKKGEKGGGYGFTS